MPTAYPSSGVGPLDRYEPACLDERQSSSTAPTPPENVPDEVACEPRVDDRRVPELVSIRRVARDAELFEYDRLVLRLLGRGVVLDPVDTPCSGVSCLSPAQLCSTSHQKTLWCGESMILTGYS